MTALNVPGGSLTACSFDPSTGFFRDGCCQTDKQDHGTQVVCALRWDEALLAGVAPHQSLSRQKNLQLDAGRASRRHLDALEYADAALPGRAVHDWRCACALTNK